MLKNEISIKFFTFLKPKKFILNILKIKSSKFSEKDSKPFSLINDEPHLNQFSYKINTKEITLPDTSKRSSENYKPLIENEDYRELYKSFSLVVREDMIGELDNIIHNEKINEKEYKYGLSVKNELKFTDLIPKDETQEEPKTATENLYELLNLDEESSYESLVLKFNQAFNTEIDMYGNELPAGSGEVNKRIFEIGIPIPREVINNETFMKNIRKWALYNVDLPGNIEDVHPNKFIADLRPIEDFRHTPIVPIEEKEMKIFKKKIEDKNRVGVYFEVKKQTLYYYSVAIIFSVFVYLTFKYFSKENEKISYEVEKMRLRRYRYRTEEDIN